MLIKIKSTKECLKIDEELHGLSESTFNRLFAGNIFEVNTPENGSHIVTIKNNGWYIPSNFCDVLENIVFEAELSGLRKSLNRYCDHLSALINNPQLPLLPEKLSRLELTNYLDKANKVVFDLENLLSQDKY